MKDSHVLQFVGYSRTGKTTLIGKLIEKLSERDVEILTLKSARQHEYALSDKDSELFVHKGSLISFVIFKNITQIILNKTEDLINLVEKLIKLFKIDLVLVEGFKELNFPKIILWSEEISKNLNSFNFEGINYLFCTKEDLDQYNSAINKINELYSFNIITEEEDLIEQIIQDYDI